MQKQYLVCKRTVIMKVLLLNGSPHTHGCTYTALEEVAGQLNKNGIETEIVQIGTDSIRGCIACGKCGENNRCIFDDVVNEILEKMEHADGLVVGTPVYYASPNGSLISLLDRLFYASGGQFAYKPAAAVASARRAGTTVSLDVINKYFMISRMPVVSSKYWNMVHGNTPEQVRQDKEGIEIMQTLGNNMAWLLKCIEAGKTAGVVPMVETKRDDD